MDETFATDPLERLRVLEMIDSGAITAGEGLILLRALSGDSELETGNPAPTVDAYGEVRPEKIHPASFQGDVGKIPDMDRWQQWWMIPLWIGVAITVGSGALMAISLQTQGGPGFWFYCAWVPLLVGVGLMALAWSSQNTRWLHIRVNQKSGDHPRRLALSFPLPIQSIAWLLRVFGGRIPGLNQTGLDELILALEEHPGQGPPIHVLVNEGENGEKVEVFIG